MQETLPPLTAHKGFEALLSDPAIRKQLRRKLKAFGLLYFPHHICLPPGVHHEPMISAMEDPSIEFLEVIGFPLVNDADEWASCLWKAQYPDQSAINDARKNAGAIAWEREYKLKVVSEDGAIITPEDIHYYDEFPPKTETTNDKGEKVRIPAPASLKGHGVDLAISEKESADYTAIASGDVFYIDDGPKIYVRPDPFNQHVTFHDTMKRVRAIPGELKGANLFFVEDVGYQKAAIQEMERAMLPVIPMKPTADKRSRLQVIAPYIKNGTVLFPRSGCEQLLAQMFNLGVEAHDDLCDALVWLVQGLVDQGLELPKIHWIDA